MLVCNSIFLAELVVQAVNAFVTDFIWKIKYLFKILFGATTHFYEVPVFTFHNELIF
jgi:hypothetical protein